MSGLPAIHHSESDGRWELIRDALVFQLKLMLDALRDLVFGPLSILAALFDLLTGGDHPGRSFHAVLAAGGRTEVWINLFGAPRTSAPGVAESRDVTVDSLVKQVESLVVDQFERGGVTASAKRAIDRSLDSIARQASRLERRPERH